MFTRVVRLLAPIVFLYCLAQFVISSDVGETAAEKGFAESGVDWVATIESLSLPLIALTLLAAIFSGLGLFVWAVLPAVSAIAVRVVYNFHMRSYFDELESLVAKIESRPQRTISDFDLLSGDLNLLLLVSATVLLLAAICERALKARKSSASPTH